MCSRKDFRPILLFCIFFGFFTFSAFSASALPIKPDPGDGPGGAQTPGQPPANVAATPGTPRSWEGHIGVGGNNVKTGNGNKQTSFPIVGWQVRGGMSVNFSLIHNSQSNRGSAFGNKWVNSYESAISTNGNGSYYVCVYWGDGRVDAYTWNGSTYSPPAGVHDTLVVNGNPVTSYDVISKSQNQIPFQWQWPLLLPDQHQ